MVRALFILPFFIILHFSGLGQSSTPKYSNEFLSIGIGARGMGMANTQTAAGNDVTTGYWNPAGLNSIKENSELGLMHAEYFAGIAKFDYGAFATSIDSLNTLGVSLIRFGVDEIPDTRFLYDASGRINYDNIRFFSAADYALLFSFNRELRQIKGLSMGANFKIIHRRVGEFANAWGFGLDAGALWKRNQWNVGLMLRDVSGTFNAWSHNTEMIRDIYTSTGNKIPVNSLEITLPKAIIGVSRIERMFNSKIGVLAAADFRLTFDGKRNVLLKGNVTSVDPSVGLEFDYDKLVFLRFGAGNFQTIKSLDGQDKYAVQPDFGLGINLGKVDIDYALTDIGDQAAGLYSHVFSLIVGFEKHKNE